MSSLNNPVDGDTNYNDENSNYSYDIIEEKLLDALMEQ